MKVADTSCDGLFAAPCVTVIDWVLKRFFLQNCRISRARDGEAYPELLERQAYVEKTLNEEEQQFARTLENGMTILEKAIGELSGSVIAGETVFKLYDTYGFPLI